MSFRLTSIMAVQSEAQMRIIRSDITLRQSGSRGILPEFTESRGKLAALNPALAARPLGGLHVTLNISACAQVSVRDAGRGALHRPPRAAASSLPVPLLLRRGGGGVPRSRQARPPHAGALPAPPGPRARRAAPLYHHAPPAPARLHRAAPASRATSTTATPAPTTTAALRASATPCAATTLPASTQSDPWCIRRSF